MATRGWRGGPTRSSHSIISVVVLISLMVTAMPSSALVTYYPIQPDHEDRMTISYVPEAGDNTTSVHLMISVNDSTQEDIDITSRMDPATSSYRYDLGLRPPGTTLTFSVIAWNRTVGDGNISVASVVEMRWHEGWDEAKAVADALSRPMMVLFWESSHRTDHDLLIGPFNDELVLNLSASFVCLKVDMDNDRALSDQMGVVNTPTLVFFDNTSQEVHRFTGRLDAKGLLAHMHYALGTGPRPEDPLHPMFANPLRGLVVTTLVLICIVAVVALRGGSRKR